jgi:hypothetical protein
MSFDTHLGEALKYVTNAKEDFYHQLADHSDLTPHGGFADYLQNSDDPSERQVGERLTSEVNRQLAGDSIRRPHAPEEYNKDYVLHSVRTGHPNPTVRALAGKEGEKPHPDFFKFLMSFDPTTHPAAHDIAVYLAEHDKVRTGPAVAALKKINRNHIYDAGGLFAKVVNGRVYLMDSETPDPNGHDAPSIIFDADQNDEKDLNDMVRHTNALVRQRINERHLSQPVFS